MMNNTSTILRALNNYTGPGQTVEIKLFGLLELPELFRIIDLVDLVDQIELPKL